MQSNAQRVTETPAISPAENLPIDMALNHGTYCSDACLEVLRRYTTNTSLRHFPHVDNRELRETIARDVGVTPEHIFLHNGSGPLLKLCIPYVIEKKIKSSLGRIAKHLIGRRGYPIVTPRLTYFKVPAGAAKNKLTWEMLPLDPETGFTLSMESVSARLDKGECLLYLSNPNNPTGNILITRDQLKPLLLRYPETTFFIDEAYVEYLPESRQYYMGDMVPEHPNMMVMRSFSFAHGLGAARIGFIVANPELVKEFEAKVTPHRVNQLSVEMAVAAVNDKDHLKFVRQELARERSFLIDNLRTLQGVEPFESGTNFFLCRLRGGRSAKQLSKDLQARGVKIKIFDALPGYDYDDYFRITVGLPAENQYLLEQLRVLLG